MASYSHQKGHPANPKIPLINFTFQSSAVVHENGKQLSSGPYRGKAYWFPVKVPSTVLSGLVANDVYPSPYYGLNNMRIPDMNDSTNRAYNLSQYSHLPNQKNPWKKPYWYRTHFKLSGKSEHTQQWLHFKGINYRAEVWLNGHQIADSTDMVGMFRQYRFNVTDEVRADSTNYLAVKIYPLDHPGLPAPPQLEALGPFYPNGGPTGDIGKNVTMLCSVGWDWMPAVRDREMGIWQPVYLSSSGPVTIDDPQVVTKLPDLPDTSRAGLNLKMKLTNHGSSGLKGKLHVYITPQNFDGPSVQFTRPENVNANSEKEITLSYKDIRSLLILNPHLWWPNGYGKPNLYNLELSYSTNGQRSQTKNITFGIRTVSSKVVDVDGWPRRDFYVNGQTIKLTGGAWVPDMLLQRDSLRYAQEMGLIQHANLNTVRIWGGGIAPPDVFYEQADRHGLLVWQDFWVTGDTNGEFKGSPDWPLQGDVYIANMRSTIKRVRNHPSLLVWTGGNEGHARKSLYDAMRQSVAQLDGTRPFIPSSSGFAKLPEDWNGSWPDNSKSGVYSGGPYSWQPPEQYYELVNAGKDWVWKDEVGIPSQPPYSSLPDIIPDLVPDSTKPYPLNNTWGYHDAASGNGKYDTYYRAIKNRYGEPQSYVDYSNKAQLANANGYRAIFESVGSKLQNTGGVLLWKLNAAFPSVIWQIYDWYLNPNAGYYYIKRAVEPLHVQLNLDDSTVAVVNRRFQVKKNLTLHTQFFNKQLTQTYEQHTAVNAPAGQAEEVQSLAEVLGSQRGLTFVRLTLNNEQDQTLSQNLYWLNADHNFKALDTLPKSRVEITQVRQINSKRKSWKIRLRNPSDHLAFFVRGSVKNKQGKKMLPAYWSDNYFSMPPNTSRTITIDLHDAPADNVPSQLVVNGNNIKAVTYKLNN